MVLCDEYYVLVQMSATTINFLLLNCFKYLLKLTKYYSVSVQKKKKRFIGQSTLLILQLLFEKNTPATSQICSYTPVLRCPYAFFIFMAVFSIRLFRSQANQPAAHLTSRSFICIFAELYSVYSSPRCTCEDPCISLAVSLLPFTRSQIHMPQMLL